MQEMGSEEDPNWWFLLSYLFGGFYVEFLSRNLVTYQPLIQVGLLPKTWLK
jgi:hypothetical protein